MTENFFQHSQGRDCRQNNLRQGTVSIPLPAGHNGKMLLSCRISRAIIRFFACYTICSVQ